jgi:hypothetical protein
VLTRYSMRIAEIEDRKINISSTASVSSVYYFLPVVVPQFRYVAPHCCYPIFNLYVSYIVADFGVVIYPRHFVSAIELFTFRLISLPA